MERFIANSVSFSKVPLLTILFDVDFLAHSVLCLISIHFQSHGNTGYRGLLFHVRQHEVLSEAAMG